MAKSIDFIYKMGRPKKKEAKETEAVEVAKQEAEAPAVEAKEKAKPEAKKVSKVVTKKSPEPEPEEFVREGKNRGEATTYKVYLGGIEQWFTKVSIENALQRKMKIVIPQGSPFESPLMSGCEGCR